MIGTRSEPLSCQSSCVRIKGERRALFSIVHELTWQSRRELHILASRIDQSQGRVSTFEVYHGVGVRATIGREVFERPAVMDQRLFDRGLVQRRVHRFTKARMAETAARPVHPDPRTVDDDAHRLRAANEQPRLRGPWGGSQTRLL